MSCAQKSEKDQDTVFLVNSPGVAWCSLVDTFLSLKTQGASLALPPKLDSVRIGTNDDPTLKLLEMQHTARSLRSSYLQWQHLSELYVIGKFVNALPREYDIKKQMLEEREDGFSRDAVVSSVKKRFESSSAYKQLRCSKPKSGENQAFALTGGSKNYPGCGGSRQAVEDQADHRVAVEPAAAARAAEMAARVADVFRVGELAAEGEAPRPRSRGGRRAGCARATSITSVTAPNRSARGVARGATT